MFSCFSRHISPFCYYIVMSQGRKHISPPSDLEFPRTLHEDRHRLEEVQVPVVTISATFRTDITAHLGEKSRIAGEAVFSRAHYSMGVAILSEAKRRKLTAWLIDPTNYVSQSDWQKIVFIKYIGQIAARTPFIKQLKEVFDRLARNKLPLSQAVQKPLLYVTERVNRPVVSLHY